MLKKIKMVVFLSSFLFIFLMFSSILFGIKIDSFNLFNFKISQFYLKMDKKLIVTANKIEFNLQNKTDISSIEDIKDYLELLPNILNVFQKVDIKELKIDGEIFNILLDNNVLDINNNHFKLISNFEQASKQLTLNIDILNLKDFNTTLKGKLKLDYFNNELKYFGNVFYDNLQTDANIDISDNKIKFFVRSEYFENLHFLKKFLNLPNTANLWMYDNVVGDFKLDWFYGEFDLTKNAILERTLQGEAHIKNAKINFEKSVESIFANKIAVKFKNDTLHFDLIEAKYKNKELRNSFLTILNLTDELKGKVLVNIETKTALDRDILNILKAYSIELPVLQKSGLTDAKIFLELPYDKKLTISSKGEFIVEDGSIIDISGFVFLTKGSNIVLENSMLYINESSFIYEDMINSTVNLKLDLNSLKANGDINIHKLYAKSSKNQELINLQDTNSQIFMDFSKNLAIDLKDIKTSITYDDFLTINVYDLSKFAQYSKILRDNFVKDGDLTIKFLENQIDFEAELKGVKFPIKKFEKIVDSLEIVGTIKDDNVLINTKDETIQLTISDKTTLFLDGYDIFYSNSNINTNEKMDIFLINSRLFLEDKIYNIKDSFINIDEHQIYFEAYVSNLNLPLSKNAKRIDELRIKGRYENDTLYLQTMNEDLNLQIKDSDFYTIRVDEYDINFNTTDDSSAIKNIDIFGKNSNIIINNKNIILADMFELNLREDRKFFYLEHKETKASFKQNSRNEIEIYISKMDKNFVNMLVNKEIMLDGIVNLFAIGNLADIKGKLIIKNSTVMNLTILNNIILLVESSPAIINPFLAIPSLLGINKIGLYKVEDGVLEFSYNFDKNFIDIKNLHTAGNGIDFDGFGTVDLIKNEINSKLKLIFMKNYSSIFEHIPVLNYIFLGDDKRVETLIEINGNLKDPVLKTNLLKDGFNAPLNIFKRVFSYPSGIFNSLINKKENE